MTKKLTHFLTRDAPLMAIEWWYKGRMHSFKAYTGFRYPLTVFCHRNGTFEFFTDMYEFDFKLPNMLSGWIKENNEKFNYIRRKLVQGLEYFEKSRNASYESADQALQELIKVGYMFGQGFIGVFIAHHLPHYNENFKRMGKFIFDKNLIDRVVKWREAEGNIFFNEGVETINFLINKIADLTKWNFDDLKYLTLEEIIECVDRKTLPKEIIKIRKSSTYFYFDDRVIYENEVSSALKSLGYGLIREPIKKELNFLKGSIANQGKARGKVRIILNRTESGKFCEGEILVAPMTSPWYTKLMEKSSAIITDEGGITCHAAIISREMNKPCVIGTKIATKVFKDGDIVEVDADSGIITRIK